MKRKLDVLFINPGGHRRIYQNLSDNLSAKESPIWVGLLAQHARSVGLSVEVVDANAADLSPEEVAAAVASAEPKLAVVVVYGHNPNASTFQMPAATDICNAIKEQDAAGKVLLLGGHVAALPERSLRETAADYVCGGEGPHTITALTAALAADYARPELDKVPGLYWIDGLSVRKNASAPLLTDLDRDLPGMAWDLLPMERYRAHNWHCFGGFDREPYAAIYTTLGCPFQCTFCCIQAPFKSGEAAAGMDTSRNSYRRWSPDVIVGQLERLANEYGVKNVKIADELFVLHKGHVEAICDGIVRRGLDLNIWAYARVDTCSDRALLGKMARAGVRWLAIGIESANEGVRKDVAKGYRPETVASTIQGVRDAGIHVMGNYIFGLPEDDHATMRETLDFAKELNTEFANFFSAMAYPGSQLYRDALANDWQLPADWAGYSQHSKSCLPLPTRHLSGQDVLAFRDRAFVEYFDRIEYRERAAQAFGSEVLGELDAMLQQRLPRENVLAAAP